MILARKKVYRSIARFRMAGLILAFSVIGSCKKPDERRCFKSTGEAVEIEIPLDSTKKFELYKNLRYEIFQDTLRKVVIRGGANVAGFVEVEQQGLVTVIRNLNACNFLRDPDDRPVVEIHYPDLQEFYIEPSDSVIFQNTVSGDSLFVEMRDGGGSARLDVNVDFLRINVSHGTADYTLSGMANNAEVKIQNNGFADASGFHAGYVFLFQNSTGDLLINLENTTGLALIEGTGDILYTGSNVALTVTRKGSGAFIKL